MYYVVVDVNVKTKSPQSIRILMTSFMVFHQSLESNDVYACS